MIYFSESLHYSHSCCSLSSFILQPAHPPTHTHTHTHAHTHCTAVCLSGTDDKVKTLCFLKPTTTPVALILKVVWSLTVWDRKRFYQVKWSPQYCFIPVARAGMSGTGTPKKSQVHWESSCAAYVRTLITMSCLMLVKDKLCFQIIGPETLDPPCTFTAFNSSLHVKVWLQFGKSLVKLNPSADCLFLGFFAYKTC